MTKIVINQIYGGFSISKAAYKWLRSHGVNEDRFWFSKGPCEDYYTDLERHHPLLIQMVEKLKKKASGDFANLVIKEIPGSLYKIREYDGFERVVTPEMEARGWIDASKVV